MLSKAWNVRGAQQWRPAHEEGRKRGRVHTKRHITLAVRPVDSACRVLHLTALLLLLFLFPLYLKHVVGNAICAEGSGSRLGNASKEPVSPRGDADSDMSPNTPP